MLQYRVIERYINNNDIIYVVQENDDREENWTDYDTFYNKVYAIALCISLREKVDKEKGYKVIY